MVEDRASLERSLAPLWKITVYSGVLFDWIKPTRHHCASVVLRCLVIGFSFLILLGQMTLSVVKTAMIINAASNLQEIVNELIPVSGQSLIIFTWFYCLLCRSSFLAFFKDWKIIERKFTPDYSSIKRLCIVVYFIYSLLCVLLVTLFILIISFNEGNPVEESTNTTILDHYPQFISTIVEADLFMFLPLYVIAIVTIFMSILDIVPSLVYYHIAKMIQAMEMEVKQVVRDGPRPMGKPEIYYTFWTRFEDLRVIINRADELFGPMIIVNHGLTFFMICCVVFSILDSMKNQQDMGSLLVSLLTLIAYPSRLLFGILCMSKVHTSATSLLSTVACVWSNRWYSLNDPDTRCLRVLVSRLHQAKLAACPSGYYKIRPSILLTILSLVVSYTVILLQSR